MIISDVTIKTVVILEPSLAQVTLSLLLLKMAQLYMFYSNLFEGIFFLANQASDVVAVFVPSKVIIH